MSTDSSDEAHIRALIERWVQAVQERDIAGVLAGHADDIVMFDVPPPNEVRGKGAYRETWQPFFDYLEQGAVFEIVSLETTVGTDVAFAHGLLRCGTASDLAEAPDSRLRLTIGLRKLAGGWVVSHEHHSFPSR